MSWLLSRKPSTTAASRTRFRWWCHRRALPAAVDDRKMAWSTVFHAPSSPAPYAPPAIPPARRRGAPPHGPRRRGSLRRGCADSALSSSPSTGTADEIACRRCTGCDRHKRAGSASAIRCTASGGIGRERRPDRNAFENAERLEHGEPTGRGGDMLHTLWVR